MTVFSAPDYPQFQADGEERYNNVAAVAVLSSPGYDEPRFVQYNAVLPRPAVSSRSLSMPTRTLPPCDTFSVSQQWPPVPLTAHFRLVISPASDD